LLGTPISDLERRNSIISPDSIALQANYITVVEDIPIMSAKYRLLATFNQNWPTQQLHVFCDS